MCIRDRADVLILPSFSEPWGLVVNEAMVCGMPVIVSNKCGCAADLVRPGAVSYTHLDVYKRQLRNPTNPLTLFLAYFFVYFMVLLISNGRPYDVSFWFPYAVMIRFLGITYLDSKKEVVSIDIKEFA